MVNKYFHLGVTVELLEGMQATVTTSLVQSYGLRMKEAKGNKKVNQMIHFNIVNQSQEKKLYFRKDRLLHAIIWMLRQVNVLEWRWTRHLLKGSKIKKMLF